MDQRYAGIVVDVAADRVLYQRPPFFAAPNKDAAVAALLDGAREALEREGRTPDGPVAVLLVERNEDAGADAAPFLPPMPGGALN